MGDQIKKTIEKLHEAGCYLREPEPIQRPNNESLISVLDLEKQKLNEKREKLKTRRQEAIKNLQEKGFPTFRPDIDEADHSTLCTGIPPQIRPVKNSLVNPDPDKPQNRLPLSDNYRSWIVPAENIAYYKGKLSRYLNPIFPIALFDLDSEPKNFNSSKFDNMMPRYDFINEDRPYEV
ncbi:hypothetical protein X801_07882 [Opisthorchis viverrini]|uniref:Uncharacterized protein n=1 Tax=Opisthorchis viverrini TaxID=6198 RepID=A0A1S8WPJ0_OPIVI|nr:hypothetical protein X801_07882 [Opisthorchis viverrini]